MCDYSLQAVKSRPAVVGEKLITHDFGLGTRGFACQDDTSTAVCVLPGTELAFSSRVLSYELPDNHDHVMAIFRQINKDKERAHHDALEFPNGTVVTLNTLATGQQATVLQLPAAPKTPEEAKDQERLAVVG